MQRVFWPAFRAGRPPIDMLITSTLACFATKIMPSRSACDVQPATNRQARDETIFAPGAAPLIDPPKRLLPAAIPATCEPCAPETMPMLTNLFLPSVWTTNGTRSAIAVAGLSVPNQPWSRLTAKSVIAFSPVKLLSAFVSTQTLLSDARQRTANFSLQTPFRLRSEPQPTPYSLAAPRLASAKRP